MRQLATRFVTADRLLSAAAYAWLPVLVLVLVLVPVLVLVLPTPPPSHLRMPCLNVSLSFLLPFLYYLPPFFPSFREPLQSLRLT